jgi:threonylcarbamoyladenosine tRNA methylthiotransferase MtaB
MIVGFPGETEAEHEASRQFLASMELARSHVFTFSPRPGTLAAEMADQVPSDVARRRHQALQDVSDGDAQCFANQFLGRQIAVLFEKRHRLPATGQQGWSGLTGNYLRVWAADNRELAGSIHEVALQDVVGSLVIGRTT